MLARTFAAALAATVLIAPSALADGGFDPTCGLSGGAICGQPDPAPSTPPASKPKPPARRHHQEQPGRWLEFSLQAVPEPTTVSPPFNPAYVSSSLGGSGAFKVRRVQPSRQVRITKGKGSIVLVNHFLGYSDSYTLAVRGGGWYMPLDDPVQYVRRLVVGVTQSDDPDCPVGRAGFVDLTQPDAREIVALDTVRIALCGRTMTWVDSPATRHVVLVVIRPTAHRG